MLTRRTARSRSVPLLGAVTLIFASLLLGPTWSGWAEPADAAQPSATPATTGGPPTAASALSDAGLTGHAHRPGPRPRHLRWRPCHQEQAQEQGVVFECATLWVPLDHDRARGRRTPVALLRVPATDPDNRIGSILVNPGGPGLSGVDFAMTLGPQVGPLLGTEVAERFDLVGFDPRGVARSKGLVCSRDRTEVEETYRPLPGFPDSDAEEASWIEGDTWLAEACERRGGRMAEHMSTANVARDMDLIRAALGDAQLTYYGGSYGSFLGLTYAAMFPSRVRAIAVDGVLDPRAWANAEGVVPKTDLILSHQGAQQTLERFFELCDAAGPPACAIAPHSAARFDAVAAAVRAEPLTYVDPATGEPVTVTYGSMIDRTSDVLYDPFLYAAGAQQLAGIEYLVSLRGTGQGLEGVGVPEGHAVPLGRWRRPHVDNLSEASRSVACTDSNNPDDYAVYAASADQAEALFGHFGRLWTWRWSVCAQWPFTDEDRFLGPWTVDTANPVLLVGNLYDPGTPYAGAQAARSLLPNSSLVTVDLPGHTALGASPCAVRIVGAYLLDPATAVAADGTVCPQELNPFPAGALRETPGVAPEVREQMARPRDR